MLPVSVDLFTVIYAVSAAAVVCLLNNMADLERIRLVILGGAGVGKSSIVKRFLFKTYTDKYRATVEDLYNREYDLGGVTLKVSFQHFFVFLFQNSFE